MAVARALVALSQDHLAAYNPFPQAKMPLMEISLTLTDWLLEIVEAMGDNYCRCGCYTRIFGAVEKAAEEMKAEQSVENAS